MDEKKARLLKHKSLLREVKDFPREGIRFQDIDPLVNDPTAFRDVIEAMCEPFVGKVDLVAGPEARGYIFSAAMALQLNAGIVLVRKPGKLPADKISQSYGLEYGKNTIECQTSAIKPGQRVLIVDDLLATGGTVEATGKLVKQLKGEVVGCACLVELKGLAGRKLLEDSQIPVHCVYEIEV